MRAFRLFAVGLFFAVIFAPIPWASNLRADGDETPEIKQKVHFVSIEAKTLENETSITWKGNFGAALKDELEKLARQKGYTYFRIANEATKEIGSKTRGEYRLDADYDYYFEPIVDSVKTWRDHENKEHKYVEISGPIVLRQDGNENTTAKVKFGREIGCYYLLNFVMFYKHEGTDGNTVKTDLILAVEPKN